MTFLVHLFDLSSAAATVQNTPNTPPPLPSPYLSVDFLPKEPNSETLPLKKLIVRGMSSTHRKIQQTVN